MRVGHGTKMRRNIMDATTAMRFARRCCRNTGQRSRHTLISFQSGNNTNQPISTANNSIPTALMKK